MYVLRSSIDSLMIGIIDGYCLLIRVFSVNFLLFEIDIEIILVHDLHLFDILVRLPKFDQLINHFHLHANL